PPHPESGMPVSRSVRSMVIAEQRRTVVPMGTWYAHTRSLPTGPEGRIDEQPVIGEPQMIEIAGTVGVRDGRELRIALAQLAKASSLLVAAAVGSGERAVESITDPAYAGADSFGEAQTLRDCGHVEVRARAHEHEQ